MNFIIFRTRSKVWQLKKQFGNGLYALECQTRCDNLFSPSHGNVMLGKAAHKDARAHSKEWLAQGRRPLLPNRTLSLASLLKGFGCR